MSSAQRFFSIAIGAKAQDKLTSYFNASLGIHIIIGSLMGVVLLLLTPFLFSSFLNIPEGKETVATMIYLLMILSSVSTIATIPYSAMMNAWEDMVALSVIDILYCFGKLAAALILMVLSGNLLIAYSLVMLGAVVLKMLLEIVWSGRHYSEIKFCRRMLYNKTIYRGMLGFVGWNTLGSVAVIARNQGVAIVLNIFFGTIVNAAYGIANQVNALVLSFATTLTSVFTPMIIQAKGAGNDRRMMGTALFSSKMAFYLSSIMALPLLLFMPDILCIWLGNYPIETELFCHLIILSFLVQQLYPGINRAIYATGKIKGYQISLAIILISIIPIGYALFKMSFASHTILIVMLISQTATMLSTVYFAHKHCNLNVMSYFWHCIVLPVGIFVALAFLFASVDNLIHSSGLAYLVIYSGTAVLLYTIVYMILVLNREEKNKLLSIVIKKK